MPVSRVKRVRFGPVNRPPRLKRGMMLELSPKEVTGLLEWAGLATPKAPPRQLTAREKEKAGVAFTPKPKREARERVAASERRRHERQRDEERNAPGREKTSREKSSLENSGYAKAGHERTGHEKTERARPVRKQSPASRSSSGKKTTPRRRAS